MCIGVILHLDKDVLFCLSEKKIYNKDHLKGKQTAVPWEKFLYEK